MNDKVSKFVGTIGLLIGPLFLPFVFQSLFAMGPFSKVEMVFCLLFSLLLICASLLIFVGRIKDERFPLIGLAIFLILSIELSARAFIRMDESRLSVNKDWMNSTYSGKSDFSGHPFLQFTGHPNWYRGFPTVAPEKNKSKVRVVTLGGSTTASGYPNYLRENLGEKFEVLNFGQAYFTSMHTMVNYFINVQELNPDYIVIHQGWNDNVARNSGKEFSSDYSHALISWELPFIPDKYLIRMSALYRHLKHSFTPFPSWRFIDHNLHKKRVHTPENYNDLSELVPFKRNIKTIINSAAANGTKVILTTQPFVTSGKNLDENMGRHIEQCNQIMRELSKEYSSQVQLVDLFELMQGKYENEFTDLAHMTEAGKKLKADFISESITP